MPYPKNHMTLEEEMLLLNERASHGFISLREFLHILSGKGRYLLLMFLALPFCQPVQIPFLSLPFAAIIAFLSLRIAFGKRIWLPRSLLQKTLSSTGIQRLSYRVLKILRKIHLWTHPRLPNLCNYPYIQYVNATLLFICSVFLALPLPIPLSNLAAAWAILVISWGTLEDDGIFLLLGYSLILFTVACFVLTAITLRRVF